MTLTGTARIPLPPTGPLPPGRHPIDIGDNGLPRVAGVLVSCIVGFIESGWTESEVVAFYAAGGSDLNADDVGAAVEFCRPRPSFETNETDGYPPAMPVTLLPMREAAD